jgi:hypothetical protein
MRTGKLPTVIGYGDACGDAALQIAVSTSVYAVAESRSIEMIVDIWS